jgi:AcrR family transcriptional regulator
MSVDAAAKGAREQRKDERRRAILEGADRLFRARGFELSTVEQIAAEARVSPATVFNYFPSKSEMLIALVAAADARYLARLRRARGRGEVTPAELLARRLEGMSRESLRVVPRDAWRHVFAAAVLNAQQPEVLAFEDLNNRLIDGLGEIVKDLQDEGEVVAETDARDLARLLFDIDQAHFARLVADERTSFAEYGRRLRVDIERVLRGLRPR